MTLEGTSKAVSGALVYIVPVPYNWAHASAEVPTATDGRVAIKIQTTKALPHSGALVMQIGPAARERARRRSSAASRPAGSCRSASSSAERGAGPV